ncbi:hypothetical protein [Kitasatospora sp. NPDC057198]|uniref:hypothetical protein n=1 Tax=Kitasatospora sp. NPDC057198 TaxID=3346046 RepID=UPI00363E3B2A
MRAPVSHRRHHRQRERAPLGALASFALLTATAGFALLGTGSAAATQEAVRDGSFLRPLTDNWTCDGDVRRLAQGVEGRPGGFDFAGCSQQVEVRPYTTYDLTADVSGAYAFVGVSGGEVENTYLWANGAERTRLHTVVRTGGTTRTLTVYFHGWYGQGPYQVQRVSLYDSSTGLPACPDMTGAPPSSPLPSPPVPGSSPTSSPAVPAPALAPAPAQTVPPSPGSSASSGSASPTWTGPTCLIPPSAPPSAPPSVPPSVPPSASVSPPAPRPTGT